MRIEVDDLTALPKAGENAEDQRNHPALDRLFGQPYLLPGGLPSLPVTFSVDRDQRGITGLKRFKVEICAETGDEPGDADGEDAVVPLTSPTGLTVTVPAGARIKPQYRTSINLRKGRRAPDWAEGRHFVRVTPLDGNDDPMHVAGSEQTVGRHPYESDRFYVVPEGEFDEPPTPRGHHAPGLAQAINRLRCTALAEGRDPARVQCRETGWGPRGTSLKTRSLRASFGPAGVVTIDSPRLLAEAEQDVLRAPHILHGLQIDVDAAGAARLSGRADARPRPEGDAGSAEGPGEGSLKGYLCARAELFGQLAPAQATDGASDVLVVEGADPRVLRAAVEAYAEAYLVAVSACLRALDRPDASHADQWRARLYADSGDLVTGLVSSVREMRHKGMSVLVASQDPPSVPSELIELSTHMVLHRFTSPAWLRHLQKVNASLSGLNPEKLAALRPGEAYVWAGKATDEAFRQGDGQGRLPTTCHTARGCDTDCAWLIGRAERPCFPWTEGKHG